VDRPRITPEGASRPPAWQRPLPERFFGFWALGASALLTWMFVYRPYAAMQARAADVSINLEGVAVIPLLLGFGVLYGLVPRLGHRWFGDPQQPRRAWWVLAIVLVAAGFALFAWLDNELARNGYSG
jgi:hypothetical protein